MNTRSQLHRDLFIRTLELLMPMTLQRPKNTLTKRLHKVGSVGRETKNDYLLKRCCFDKARMVVRRMSIKKLEKRSNRRCMYKKVMLKPIIKDLRSHPLPIRHSIRCLRHFSFSQFIVQSFFTVKLIMKGALGMKYSAALQHAVTVICSLFPVVTVRGCFWPLMATTDGRLWSNGRPLSSQLNICAGDSNRSY